MPDREPSSAGIEKYSELLFESDVSGVVHTVTAKFDEQRLEHMLVYAEFNHNSFRMSIKELANPRDASQGRCVIRFRWLSLFKLVICNS